jgi:hypothetical protein
MITVHHYLILSAIIFSIGTFGVLTRKNAIVVFYFAVTDDFPKAVLPKDEGLMIADAFAADILRPGQYRPISAARRKAMLIRFARLAAGRFQTLFGMLS